MVQNGVKYATLCVKTFGKVEHIFYLFEYKKH